MKSPIVMYGISTYAKDSGVTYFDNLEDAMTVARARECDSTLYVWTCLDLPTEQLMMKMLNGEVWHSAVSSVLFEHKKNDANEDTKT
jgi:hypothetical protein